MSLMKAENRERFKADERAYLDQWPMNDQQKQAVLDRDYNRIRYDSASADIFAASDSGLCDHSHSSRMG